MPPLKCPQCKNNIFDMSNSCPICGFQMTLDILTEIVRKEQQTKKIILIGIIFVLTIICILTILEITKPDVPQADTEARRAQIEKQFSVGDGSHPGLTALIKKSMNDPGSYEHIKTVYKDE